MKGFTHFRRCVSMFEEASVISIKYMWLHDDSSYFCLTLIVGPFVGYFDILVVLVLSKK